MKYQVLFTIFFFLLLAKTGFAQNAQPATVNHTVVPANADSSDLNMQVTIGDFEGNRLIGEVIYFGMPILNPRSVDAKMRYWWPSTDYNYNMPNAYPNKRNPFRFKYPKQDN